MILYECKDVGECGRSFFASIAPGAYRDGSFDSLSCPYCQELATPVVIDVAGSEMVEELVRDE